MNASEPPARSPFVNHASPRHYHVFHLVKAQDVWSVIDAHSQDVLFTCTHEFTARQKIIEFAQAARPSRVVIYNTAGKICGSSMYP